MSRFEGIAGRRAVLEVLAENRLLRSSPEAVARIADAGQVVSFADRQLLISQAEAGTDVYFILVGVVHVVVNGRKVATRDHCDAVGEMAAIDPSATRSASIVASGPVTALRLDAADFSTILDQHPSLWKPLAKTAAHRLRERGQFHRAPNPVPVLFIGSSVEGIAIGREVQSQLKHDAIDVRPWTTGVFGAGQVAIESLLAMVATADFALFVLGPDDLVASRDQSIRAPRDNVIFELGLFMGGIGRARVFMLKEHGADLKIPSDLLGTVPLTYVRSSASPLASSLGPACHELRAVILTTGAL